jgi:adenylosuccinate lyase
MAAVRSGADRQSVHEILRRHSQAAAQRVKGEGLPNDLLDRLRGEGVFAGIDLDSLLRPGDYIGRCVEQVGRFMTEIADPIRARYSGSLPSPTEPRV